MPPRRPGRGAYAAYPPGSVGRNITNLTLRAFASVQTRSSNASCVSSGSRCQTWRRSRSDARSERHFPPPNSPFGSTNYTKRGGLSAMSTAVNSSLASRSCSDLVLMALAESRRGGIPVSLSARSRFAPRGPASVDRTRCPQETGHRLPPTCLVRPPRTASGAHWQRPRQWPPLPLRHHPHCRRRTDDRIGRATLTASRAENRLLPDPNNAEYRVMSPA
jgi:hypothetical protein